MYKIRLTDTVTIQKFHILKPEVEKEFLDETAKDNAFWQTSELLDDAIQQQLKQIAARMTEKQKRDTLTDVSVDDRFKKVIKSTLKINIYLKFMSILSNPLK